MRLNMQQIISLVMGAFNKSKRKKKQGTRKKTPNNHLQIFQRQHED